MFRFRHPRVLSLFLALSLALAPLFSATSRGNALASSADTHAVSIDPHAHHLADRSAASDQHDHDSSHCATHDSCGGQCCAGCGHCATTVVSVPVPSHPVHPVQTPVVLTLHLSDLPAVQIRPPQV